MDAEKNLKEEDFANLYDLMECISRLELKELREANEKAREDLFTEGLIKNKQP